MATTFTATTAASGGTAYGVGLAGQKVVAYGEYAITGALVVNDVIEMVRVPKNARILGVSLYAPDLDTDGTPAIVLGVGDGSSTSRFISAATVGQSGGFTETLVAAGFGYQYTAEDTIDIIVSTAPDVGATSGTLKLAVEYIMY
jgi:hypothetical protein